MKTTSETHVPLTSFREYPLDEMQARAVAFHEDLRAAVLCVSLQIVMCRAK